MTNQTLDERYEAHYANLIKQGESVVKQMKYIDNTDIHSKGVFLGYDWNTICNWISKNGVYGEDGDGYTFISREGTYEPQEFQNIITAILDEADEDELKVID